VLAQQVDPPGRAGQPIRLAGESLLEGFDGVLLCFHAQAAPIVLPAGWRNRGDLALAAKLPGPAVHRKREMSRLASLSSNELDGWWAGAWVGYGWSGPMAGPICSDGLTERVLQTLLGRWIQSGGKHVRLFEGF
jgi:hypothetical protein